MKKAGLRHLRCVRGLLADIISIRVASPPRRDYLLDEESVKFTIKGSCQRLPTAKREPRGLSPVLCGRWGRAAERWVCGDSLCGQSPIWRCKTDCVRRGLPRPPVGILLVISQKARLAPPRLNRKPGLFPALLLHAPGSRWHCPTGTGGGLTS